MVALVTVPAGPDEGGRTTTDFKFYELRDNLTTTLEDGSGDAYRHCYWNGLMTRHYNESTAKGYGDRHEDHGARTGETKMHAAGAKNMDLYNNAVGRMFGVRSGATTRTVFHDCLDAAHANALRTIDPQGRIVHPGVYSVTP